MHILLQKLFPSVTNDFVMSEMNIGKYETKSTISYVSAHWGIRNLAPLKYYIRDMPHRNIQLLKQILPIPVVARSKA
jgi:hypothetical protein